MNDDLAFIGLVGSEGFCCDRILGAWFRMTRMGLYGDE